MERYQKPIVVIIFCLIFTTLFLRNEKSELHLIFQKDLLAHDESSNSVVGANLTRKFFPPMVRVNPLNEQQGNWMEGPFWQHIPPLFAYVPYIFFELDGQVTIEVKRLSYAFVTLLTGLLFILGVYRFRKSLLAAGSATLAAVYWINTPFTRELITGYAFGVSDIVLAFTIVCSFCAILWYLEKGREERISYPYWKLAVIGLIVALPIAAKNLLGAIPAATFFGLLLYDRRKIDNKFFAAGGSFLGLLALYFLPLYFASPETFKNEILVSFLHFKRLEGWGRPWHFYLTDYLPQRYLGRWVWLYFAGIILGTGFIIRDLNLKLLNCQDKILLWTSGGWFVWNLAAISAVTSKVPNFIYQSYLFSLFFIVYALVLFCHPERLTKDLFQKIDFSAKAVRITIITVLVISIVVTGYEAIHFARGFNAQRAKAYNYQTEREKFYEMAERMKAIGSNSNDLVIVRVSDNDCWARYPILFLTGAESKTLLEISFGYDPEAIKQKYTRFYFYINKPDLLSENNLGSQRIEFQNFSLIKFDTERMSSEQIDSAIKLFLADHEDDIQKDILRIKKDKTSCQWLVPDPILNAP